MPDDAKKGPPYWKIVTIGAFLLIAVLVFAYRQTPPPIVITILGEDSANLKAIESLADDYQKQSGVKIKIVPQKFEDLDKIASADLSRGTGRYDIILNYNFSLSSYVRNNWVFTLAELKDKVADHAKWENFESDIFEKAWKELGYYRRQSGVNATEEAIGYPFAANSMLLCYNRRLFEDPQRRAAYKQKFSEELGPPIDWPHFKRLAEFFTPADGSTHGVVLQGGSDGWFYYEWVNFAFSMGGGVMDKQWGWDGDEHTPLLISTPKTLAATKFYLDLKPYNTGDFFSVGANEQREIMRGGRTAMAIMWSDYVYGLLYDAHSHHEQEFGFSPIPGDRSMLAGGIYFVNRHSQYPREAAEFIMYLMQKNRQAILMQRGLASALRSAYDDPSVRRLPYTEALRQSLERGVYMNEAGPDSNMVQVTLTANLQKIWKGELSVDAGLQNASREIDQKRTAIYKSIK